MQPHAAGVSGMTAAPRANPSSVSVPQLATRRSSPRDASRAQAAALLAAGSVWGRRERIGGAWQLAAAAMASGFGIHGGQGR